MVVWLDGTVERNREDHELRGALLPRYQLVNLVQLVQYSTVQISKLQEFEVPKSLNSDLSRPRAEVGEFALDG